MSTVDKLLEDAAKLKNINDAKNVIIDANISLTKADFSAFNGLALTHPTLSLTTLQIDTASYNGSANNEITIAIDGSGTWTTVKAIVSLPGGQQTAVNPNGLVYYEAVYKTFDGNDSLPGIVRGNNAYEIFKKLQVHTILDV